VDPAPDGVGEVTACGDSAGDAEEPDAADEAADVAEDAAGADDEEAAGADAAVDDPEDDAHPAAAATATPAAAMPASRRLREAGPAITNHSFLSASLNRLHPYDVVRLTAVGADYGGW
jgi:hypothetical protein